MERISIVIPVYNNEESLESLLSQLHQTCVSNDKITFEYVLIDDGSTDGSWIRLIELREKLYPGLKLYKLSRNFGQLAAMLTGYKLAETSDAVISISADLQDPVELIPEMIKFWNSGNKIVVATRNSREDSWFRRKTSHLAYFLLKTEIKAIPKTGFDYFLIDHKVVSHLNNSRGSYRFLQGEILWTGFSTIQLPYHRSERPYGKSQYTFWKRLQNFTDAYLDTSYSLIRLITKLGILLSTLGFFLTGVFLISRLIGDSPFSGFTPIITTILFFSGFQIFILGLIAEYTWRNYDISKNKPIAIVDKFE